MNYVFQMINFVFKLVNFVCKMMSFVIKDDMNFAFKQRFLTSHGTSFASASHPTMTSSKISKLISRAISRPL